jgi:hypothetical protein
MPKNLPAKKAAKAAAKKAATPAGITTTQLRAAMKAMLRHFNDEGLTINDATVHNTVLSATDGFGSSNSKNIYRQSVQWTLITNADLRPRWPGDWMEQSVSELASKLLASAS